MKRYNLMILKKGKTRYSFQRQFFFRPAAEMEGERLMRDPVFLLFMLHLRLFLVIIEDFIIMIDNPVL